MATCWDMYNKERTSVLQDVGFVPIFSEEEKKNKKREGEREPAANNQFVQQYFFFQT